MIELSPQQDSIVKHGFTIISPVDLPLATKFLTQETFDKAIRKMETLPFPKLWDIHTNPGTSKNIWLIPRDVENKGDYLHVRPNDASRQDGYGGSTLRFNLGDRIANVQGPWQTNSEHLKNDTGIDLMSTHYTFGFISKKRVYKDAHAFDFSFDFEKSEIIEADTGPTLGSFERLDARAYQLSMEMDGTDLHVFRKSIGGESSGFVHFRK
jgi:hypothetical protein